MPKTDDEVAFSVDEMTGIQALERIAEDLPLSSGKPLAREFEYKRNGTQTLIAAINIALGKYKRLVKIREKKKTLRALLKTFLRKTKVTKHIILFLINLTLINQKR